MTFEELKQMEVSEFHTSGMEQSFLARSGDRYFEVSAVVAELLSVIKISGSREEAVRLYAEMKEGRYSEEEIGRLIDKCMASFSASLKVNKPFIFKFELLTGERIRRLTRGFRFLFEKKVMFPLLAVFFLLDVYFYFSGTSLVETGDLNLYVVLGMLTFFIVSSFFHELGHASACQHYDTEHGGVGFGMYLNFPVFYTDVSNVWRLNRWQRCVVDIAGVYFQMLLLLPVLIAYLFSYDPILKYIILLMNVNFVITLNPFFKFDGYWIMTDAFGVPNLREKSNELIAYLFKRMRGKRVEKRPYLLSIKKMSRIVIIGYSAVMNLFFAYYFIIILPLFLVNFWKSFPSLFRTLVMDLSNNMSPDFAVVQQLVLQLIFLSVTLYFLYKIIVPLFGKLKWK